MNKYYFNQRFDVKVQKQRCHMFRANMSTVAILVLFFFLFVFFSISLHFLLLRPLVHLQTLMWLYSVKKKKVGRIRESTRERMRCEISLLFLRVLSSSYKLIRYAIRPRGLLLM
jgi:hypothetical protein